MSTLAAAPEDEHVTLSDGEQCHQLTFEWCGDEWRCAASQLWAGPVGSSGAVVDQEKNIARSWQAGQSGEPPLSLAMLSYDPIGTPATPSMQLSLTPPQAMLAMLTCGRDKAKRRVALAASFTEPMAQMLRQMVQLTDAEWAEQLTTRRRSDTLIEGHEQVRGRVW